MQALAYMGWPARDLAGRLNISLGVFSAIRLGKPPSGPGSTVTPDLYVSVCQLFRDLWDKRGPSRAVARGARHSRWAPAAAWGDADEAGHWIEDPAAIPVPGWERPGREDLAGLASHLAELFDRRYSVSAAAQYMGLSRGALDHRICRARRAGNVITLPQWTEFTAATAGRNR
jgi:hypothetical protein